MAKSKDEMKNKNGTFSDPFSDTGSAIINGIIGMGILLLVTVFPLIYHNSYVDILETKYLCYWLCALGMLVVSLFIGLIFWAIDLKEFHGEHTKELLSGMRTRNWRSAYGIADIALLIFWVSAILSTVLSDYVYESFWGNEGRYSGLYLLTLYVLVYFLISRFWKLKSWYLELFLITGMIMCVIGITDYFQLDILDFRGKIRPSDSTIFTSTVGNINTYTAYVGMIMGFSTLMFTREKKPGKLLWYYICMVISFTAIIMGCSDNAYLSIGVLFAGLPFLLFADRKGIQRYLVILASFFSVIQLIDVLNQAFPDMVIGLDSLFRIIVDFRGLLAFVIFLWLLAGGFWWYGRSQDKKTAGKPWEVMREGSRPWLVYVWGALIAAGFLAVCFMFYDANTGGHGERYGSLGSYLIFDDMWGTYRGYIWKKSIDMYKGLPFLQKCFGYGPDTFGLLANDTILFEMINATGLFFDSAHNSILQYLLTIGLIGTAGYLVFLGASICFMLKNRKGNPYILGTVGAVICYVFQSTVNIDLPIAAPMMWLLLSAGMAACRQESSEQEGNQSF
ncbi:MAG: O-antigen ligase family protein [Lachnospiraceae bacterium]|nr:O-antigen ligase family protein [Lachnospiraceae bacterium]